MKLWQASLFLVSLVVGCNQIEGHLNVTRDFQLKNSEGNQLTLRMGTYNADIKANSSNKITLRLNNDSDKKFVFHHQGHFPENGTIVIPATVSKQPVDLTGTVHTTVVNSKIKETSEICMDDMPVPTPFPIPIPPMPLISPRSATVSSVQQRFTNGIQWVRYYDRETTKNIDLIVNTTKEATELADFHGEGVTVERIVVDRTMCQ